MTYNEIAQHIKKQEKELQKTIENFSDGDEKTVKAILEGTVDLLIREGFGKKEVFYLVKNMIEISAGIMILIIDQEKRLVC